VRRARGITLIEVLVATVVCGAGVAIAAGGVAAAVRAEAYAEDTTRAAEHLDLILAQLEGGVLALEDASGTFDGDDEARSERADGLTWEVVLGTTDVANLNTARVTVRWTRHGVERELSVERLYFVDPLDTSGA